MGVKGLWDLLRPAAFQVQSLDVLSGKTVAVDISVWLHQFMLGMGLEDHDDEFFFGRAANQMGSQATFSQVRYLKALFKRICKLLYYDIKPIFIFDGATPLVKQKTIQKRRMRSTKHNFRLKKVAKKLLNRRIQEKHSGVSSIDRKLINLKKTKSPSESSDKNEEDLDFAIQSASSVASSSSSVNIVKKKEEDVSILCDERNYEGGSMNDSFEAIEKFDVNEALDLGSEIDPEIFTQLPKEIQQDIIKQLRRSKRFKSDSHIRDLKKKTPERFSSTQLNSFIKGSHASLQLKKLLEVSERQHLLNSLPQNIGSSQNNDEIVMVKEEIIQDEDQQQQEEEDMGMGFFAEDEEPSLFQAASQQTPKPNRVSSVEGDIGNFQIVAGGRLASDPNRGFVLLEKTPPQKEKDKRESILSASSQKADLSKETIQKFSDFLSRKEVIEEEIHPKTQPEQREKSTNIIDIVNEFGEDSEEEIQITFSNNEIDNISDSDMLPDSIFSTLVESENIGRNMNDEWDKVQTVVEDDEFEEVQQTEAPIAGIDDEWDEVQVQTDQPGPLPIEIDEQLENSSELIEINSDNEVEEVTQIRPTTPLPRMNESIDSLEDSFENDQEALLRMTSVPLVSEEESRMQDINAARFEQAMFDSDYPMIDLFNSKSKSTNLFFALVDLAKDLLTYLGIPYLVSPSEADAQCGFLCQHNLVDAVITEDSDLFLFGANCVYRNVFGSTRHIDKDVIEEYRMDNISKVLGFTRTNLIQLALLLGSDYTDGVHNVGPVTATQVVDAFNPEEKELNEEDVEDVIKGLKDFKLWAEDDTFNMGKTQKSWGRKGDFQINYKGSKKKFIFPESFPDSKIIDAYTKPQVDDSLSEFVWADIDSEPSSQSSQTSSSTDQDPPRLNWDGFYNFCLDRMNMSKEEVDAYIQPILSERKKRQAIRSKKVEDMTPLERFIFEADKKKKKAAEIESKRVLNAIGSIKIKQAKKRKK